MNKKFKCARCNQEFIGTQSEKEATKELENNFPGISKEDCEIICDDCYKEIQALIAQYN